MSRLVSTTLRMVLWALIMAALVGGGTTLIRRRKQGLANAPRFDLGPTPVHAVIVRRGELVHRQEYLATVEPNRTARISARLTARIEEVMCDEGDRVASNQPLARLDDREIRDDIAGIGAQIEQTRAELLSNEATIGSLENSVAYRKREADRDRKLAEKGDIAPAEAEGTEDKVNEIEGRMNAALKRSDAIGHQIELLGRREDQLKTRLSYCVIRTPFDGIVASRRVDPGDLASPGRTLIEVEDRSRLKLAFDLPQADLRKTRAGLPVGFEVEGKPRRAILSHLYPSLDLARMLHAEVNLDRALAVGLTCGAYLRLVVQLDEPRDATLIPAASLIEGVDGVSRVFVVNGESLEARTIDVLGATGEEIGVEGVEPGEMVVTSTFLGWAKLSSGLRVEVVR